MSAPELEGRTFVPWWAVPLAIPLVFLLFLAALAFAAAVVALIAFLVIMKDPGVPLSGLVLALLVTFACGSICAAAAHRLLDRHRWRARHLRSGCCPWCRYDIRGLPEPRCPECGETWEPNAVRRRIRRLSWQ